MDQENKLKVFCGNGNRPLAQKIANVFGKDLGKCKIVRFSDGEVYINIEESVRDNDVYIIQSTNGNVNEYYMELMIMIDAMKRASAKTINVVLPYYGYSRQDRKSLPHEPITAKLIANMITIAGATRVLTLDLHTVQIQGFFDIPLDNLFTIPLFANHLIEHDMHGDHYVVVAPKNSGIERARELAEYLDTTIAIVDQDSEKGYVIGDVTNKTCIIIDDMLNTGTTVSKASALLMEANATEVFVCASHAILSNHAKQLLEQSPITEIFVTDSCEVDKDRQPNQLTYISCAPLIGEAMKRIYEQESMSPLFGLEGIKGISQEN